MRVTLVAPRTVDEVRLSFPDVPVGCDAPEIPLGTLAAAAVLERAGWQPRLFDLNFRPPDGEATAAHWAGVLASEPCEIFGFGTICSSYPFTLQIAEELKRLRPEAKIFLAGPQASAVDTGTLKNFASIDMIVRGEVEQTLVPAIESIGGSVLSIIPGVTFRRGAHIERTQDPPVILDLDDLPDPAFHLFPNVAQYRVLPVEAGRGCPFGCTFCSTNDFFRRKFRMRSPRRILAEMDRLSTTHPGRMFDLVHDMFTVDRRRVADFCRVMIESGRGYRWSCSARTDCTDEQLLDLMWEAGCRGLFFGVESGSPRIQMTMDKHLDLDEARRVVQAAGERGIEVTVAFITGFPDEQREDLEATARLMLQLVRSPKIGTKVALLAPLAGTPLMTRHRNELVFDGEYCSASIVRPTMSSEEEKLIRDLPEVFPNFFAIPAALNRSVYAGVNRLITALLWEAPLLALAVEQEAPSLLSLFEDWLIESGAIPHQIPNYSLAGSFRRFIAKRCRGPKVTAVMQFHKALDQLAPQTRLKFVPTSRPRLSPSCGLYRLGFDLSTLNVALQAGADFPEESWRPTWTLVERRTSGFSYTIMPPAGVALLELCDGTRTASAILDAFGSAFPEIEGTPGYDLAAVSLEELGARGILDYKDTRGAS